MTTQTEESQNEDMHAFVDLFEKFDDLLKERRGQPSEYIDGRDRIALFGIYVSRME